MRAATELWRRHTIPTPVYSGSVAVTDAVEVAAGGGLLVIQWPPGPMTMDPGCGFIFNVYTQPVHRKHGLGRQLMDTMHQ